LKQDAEAARERVELPRRYDRDSDGNHAIFGVQRSSALVIQDLRDFSSRRTISLSGRHGNPRPVLRNSGLDNVLLRLPSQAVGTVRVGRGKGGAVAFGWHTPRHTYVSAIVMYPEGAGEQLDWSIGLRESAAILVGRLLGFGSPEVDVSLQQLLAAVQSQLAEDVRCTSIS
jgi:hypothetical protein